jgi:hypothetical protein
MTSAEILSDPLRAIQSLDVEQLRERLDQLDGESSALRVLLRSALARQKVERQRKRQASEGGPSDAA